MKTFKVLGSGCANCVNTAKRIEQTANELHIKVVVEKVTDLETIMNYQVMSTPAVVLNEQLVHSGGVPNKEVITAWLKE
ncbi:thioredoxin family protein [Agarivorans sp. TSD2052]|uniref:thioredoxin family protein n=1 Tax=Agarivorans sp. TSD2052 TaxID=2937286 RepID=UPI00200EFF45|nr:thioredoxin family protein [Agarivorans sp. TSD2052]UPW19410.1 thioredoxin family protein [Agarivorans sp. TSD2052]